MGRIEFVPFQHWHLEELNIQDAQAFERELIEGDREAETDMVYSWTAIVDRGNGNRSIVGCGGITKAWAGRGIAWAVVGNPPRWAWTAITRHVSAEIDRALAHGYRRIETHVLASFRAGRRWMTILGFRPEALCEAWGPQGEDYIQYVRKAR